MKKLGKLSINQSKALSNEELVILRGGYGYGILYDGVTCANTGDYANAVSYCIAPGADPYEVCSGYDTVITWQAYSCP